MSLVIQNKTLNAQVRITINSEISWFPSAPVLTASALLLSFHYNMMRHQMSSDIALVGLTHNGKKVIPRVEFEIGHSCSKCEVQKVQCLFSKYLLVMSHPVIMVISTILVN